MIAERMGNAMAKSLTANGVYKMLRHYVRQRPDIGARKAMLDMVLEPASPFYSGGVRSPKRCFVLFSFLAVFMFTGFVYFNRLW